MKTLLSIPIEILLDVIEKLDYASVQNLYLTCHDVKEKLDSEDRFWKILCHAEKFDHDLYSPLNLTKNLEYPLPELGFNGTPFRIFPDEDWPEYRKIFARGLQMRQNMATGNFRGWRFFVDMSLPIIPVSNNIDIYELVKKLKWHLFNTNYLKVFWNDKYLGIANLLDNGRNTILFYNIQDDPKFLYSVEKDNKYEFHDAFIFKNFIVMMPWDYPDNTILLVLDVEKKLDIVGKFIIKDKKEIEDINYLWKNRKIVQIKNTNYALFCYMTFNQWNFYIIEIPSCTFIKRFSFSAFFNTNFKFKFFNNTMIILLTDYNNSSTLVELNIENLEFEVKLISSSIIHDFEFLNNESIYFLHYEHGENNLVLFDLITHKEQIIIKNNFRSIYKHQFIRNKQDIYLLIIEFNANKPFLKVLNAKGYEKYHINLSAWDIGFFEYFQMHFAINDKFLLITSYTKIFLYDIETGKHLLNIPILKPWFCDDLDVKQFKSIHFNQDQLIIIHDHHKNLPSIVDIYRF